jgi:hypothetical protein
MRQSRGPRLDLILLLLLFGAMPTSLCVAAEPPDPTLAFWVPAGEAAGGTDPEPAPISSSEPLPPGLPGRPSIALQDPITASIAQATGAPGIETATPPAGPEEQEPSLTEVNKQLTNPVSDFWSITMQFNNYSLANHQWNYNMNFQPVLPLSLTKDWNLITRPVATLYNSVPVPLQGDSNKAYNQTTAFGDTILLEMLSPANAGPWLLGVGPTFVFPTATSYWTDQGRWQAGPATVVGYLSKEFIVGLFPQWWWSLGSTHRANTAQMNLQPFAAWFFGEGWSVGYSGNILANFRSPAKEVWTVPLGLSVGKVVKLGKLPVRFAIAGQWMAVHPTNGQEWNIQVTIAPVIPKLIKGTLF